MKDKRKGAEGRKIVGEMKDKRKKAGSENSGGNERQEKRWRGRK
jgi:hypothetical protein